MRLTVNQASTRFETIGLFPLGVVTLVGAVLWLALTGPTSGQTLSSGPILRLTATTDNLSGAHDSVRIDLLRWSTDAERDQLLSAWTTAGQPRGAGPRAAGKGARTKASAPSGEEGDPNEAGPPAARKQAAATKASVTPESALAAALSKAPTVGHLWSSEVAGYDLQYAVRMAQPDGGENITLITKRPLGAWNDSWKPVGGGTPTNYEFSVIELHLNSKGEGEGKVSLTGKVVVDSTAKTIGLENYNGLPVVLKNVRRRTS